MSGEMARPTGDAIVGAAGIAALAAYAWLFLYAENVWLVVALIVIAAGATFIAQRSRRRTRGFAARWRWRRRWPWPAHSTISRIRC
jgi:cobalamin synthase